MALAWLVGAVAPRHLSADLGWRTVGEQFVGAVGHGVAGPGRRAVVGRADYGHPEWARFRYGPQTIRPRRDDQPPGEDETGHDHSGS